MLKVTLVVAIVAGLVLVPLRFAVSSSGFFRDGIMEGIQACKEDSDCVWAATGCCQCYEGGREILINKEKKWLFNLLVKDVCLEKEICKSENYCINEEIYCDRTCKFGERTYTKPLLAP